MTVPNWRNTGSDWYHRTPLDSSCGKLHDLTLNEAALVQQETCAQSGDCYSAFPGSYDTWTEILYWGFTLRGDEPYDILRVHFAYVYCIEDLTPVYQIRLRAEIVERSEYWPSAYGLVLTNRGGGCRPDVPDRPLCEHFDIDLVPPSGAWLPNSYEVRMQVYQPTYPGPLFEMFWWCGLDAIMFKEL